jgi:hypothetical protein
MAKKNFTSWLLDLVPPRLKTGEYEIRFVQVVAHLFNAVADGASYAVRCRFIEHMPTDALGYAGADRLLERGPAELDANWRERLLLAWDAWTLAGTVHEDGLLGQIRAFGLDDETTPPLLLESQDVGAPPRSEYWSRFWLVFPPATHGHTVSIPTAEPRGAPAHRAPLPSRPHRLRRRRLRRHRAPLGLEHARDLGRLGRSRRAVGRQRLAEQLHLRVLNHADSHHPGSDVRHPLTVAGTDSPNSAGMLEVLQTHANRAEYLFQTGADAIAMRAFHAPRWRRCARTRPVVILYHNANYDWSPSRRRPASDTASGGFGWTLL